MTLTEQQIKIISERPLNDTLTHLQVKLRDLKPDHVWQEDIASLLGALLVSPAAFSLASPNYAGSVAARLLSIAQLLHGGGLTLEQFRPLMSSVVDNAPDVDIWDAVLNLIETLSPLTPPSSVVPTYRGTPVKSSSSQLADSRTRDIFERGLFFEIKDCVYRNVQGFWDKFFDSSSWCKEKKQMLRDILEAHDGKKWRDFPPDPDEQPVWAWLRSLEESCLTGTPNKLHTTRTVNQFKERKGQLDLFFQRSAQKEDGTFCYKDVLVVGEQKRSVGKLKATLLQLLRYVRDVFADQPTRRFVHAFSLCASTMELWVFDRSGLYSSGAFDIHEEPDKFARAFVGYATMDEEMMGLDTFIERKKGHRYVAVGDKNGKEAQIELKELLVRRQRAVVCRGTTCYRTRNGRVAKFSWASDKQKPEAEYLELAAARGVKGVARVEAYHQITTITDMRKGLVFPKPHRFQDFEEASTHEIAPINFKDTPVTDSESISRLSLKRKTSSDDISRSKRPRSNRQKSKRHVVHQFNEQRSNNKAKPSVYDSTPYEGFENRIYSCLVVSPAGRVIGEFTSIKELLEALRDAIRAHESLYTVGNILHRDISSNNIIITDEKAADGFKGMLIDLDLAKIICRDTDPSGAQHQTGTMQFMAIEVLRKADHTYRHDLESFFYVLIWMCARCSWTKKPPRESLLRKWEIGSFSDIADAKEGHMTINGLERIMNEFPDSFGVVKPLCLKIRSIMFGDTARLNIGTPAGGSDQLYNAILAAYDETIDMLAKE
ncbi:serine/threonine-protein kinase Sgk2 [Trichoderma chlorosporum]